MEDRAIHIPPGLEQSCRRSPQRMAWLAELPRVLADLGRRWSLNLDAPFDRDLTCSWVAPARRGSTDVVLKIGMPHMEADHEIGGLRFWNGDGMVQLLDADERLGAMLLERCKPGTPLRELAEPEQDVVLAGLLRRLWREPPGDAPFRPLSSLIAHWRDETLERKSEWRDHALVSEGLAVLTQLANDHVLPVLLATDLHAGNVLRAEREPWLAIDPKPFTGDPCYDATQHLLNCPARMRRDPRGTIDRFADLLEVDAERVHLWWFGRTAIAV